MCTEATLYLDMSIHSLPTMLTMTVTNSVGRVLFTFRSTNKSRRCRSFFVRETSEAGEADSKLSFLDISTSRTREFKLKLTKSNSNRPTQRSPTSLSFRLSLLITTREQAATAMSEVGT